jgi:hypothetical protein
MIYYYLEKTGIQTISCSLDNGFELSNDFNEPIDDDFIEKYKNANRIIFGNSFNQPIDRLAELSDKLIWLDFGCCFNQPIDNLPKSLKILILGENFCQKFINIPESITHLEIKSNTSIDDLPPSIKYLKLSGYFNNPVDNLPIGIEYIEFDCNIQYPIDNLPDSLLYLVLGHNYNQLINNLPNSLKEITINGWNSISYSIDSLPDDVEYINMHNSKYNLNILQYPKNLKKIYYSLKYNHPIDNLPNSVESIMFDESSKFNCKINKFPDSLEIIQLGKNFWYPLNKLPKNVSSINILNPKYKYAKCIKKKYPKTMLYLKKK